MKPVDQRTRSDCLRAAIASIFELALEEVPDFGLAALGTSEANVAQDTELREWLAKLGLSPVHVSNPTEVLASGATSAPCPWGLCVGNGKSPRGGGINHAVVYDAREDIPVMVHDPHSSRAGLIGEPEIYTCFLLEDPARFRAWCESRNH